MSEAVVQTAHNAVCLATAHYASAALGCEMEAATVSRACLHLSADSVFVLFAACSPGVTFSNGSAPCTGCTECPIASYASIHCTTGRDATCSGLVCFRFVVVCFTVCLVALLACAACPSGTTSPLGSLTAAACVSIFGKRSCLCACHSCCRSPSADGIVFQSYWLR